MNKKRYWKKQIYLANFIYYNSIGKIQIRAYNMAIEIDDYLFNLED